ncbi:MAG TPA: F0F1 ATP synthase subunit delta [Gaiellaceae bacterium]|nr:F0F1 ATP synthase subunit delta [Gaiellaceae bacterium]
MSAVHRTYAQALFEAAKERGRLAQVHEELADFATAVDEVPELRAVLRNPRIEPRAKARVLEELLGGADELLRNFVRLAAEKGRIAEIEEIAREFERLVARDQRRLDVELTTAFELSDAEADAIVRQIEAASGRPVDATRTVDPGLIGGLVLQAGSLRVDASVRGRFERLRRELVSTR